MSEKIDSRNIEKLTKFLKDHEHYTIPELAIKCGVCTKTIRIWKKKCGMLSANPFKKYLNVKKKNHPKIDKSKVNWNNRTWLKKKYIDEKIGIRTLCRILDMKTDKVWLLLKKYGIPVNDIKKATISENKCCSEKWLMEHYASRHDYLDWCKEKNIEPKNDGGKSYSLKECAEIAGVNKYTLRDWLVRFKISIRDHIEQVTWLHLRQKSEKQFKELETRL